MHELGKGEMNGKGENEGGGGVPGSLGNIHSYTNKFIHKAFFFLVQVRHQASCDIRLIVRTHRILDPEPCYANAAAASGSHHDHTKLIGISMSGSRPAVLHAPSHSDSHALS